MDWSWATDGITDSIPRVTGPECANYLTPRRRIFECILISGLSLWTLKWAINRLQPIQITPSPYQLRRIPTPLGKQILLIAMTFVFGMEFGFKLSTKTVIYIFNPCHITTIMQIYLLAARPSKRTTAIFRIQMNYLNGPFLAFLFPEVESRHLPLEQATYWIQHGLMFIISIYLLRLGGAYNMENLLDFNWNVIGYTILITYHFTVLHFLSGISSVNLDFVLCAARTDPFQGPNYRIAAVIHQAFLCPFLCKLFTVIFSNTNPIQLDVKVQISNNCNELIYDSYGDDDDILHHQISSSSVLAGGGGGLSSSTSAMTLTSGGIPPPSAISSGVTSIPPISISRIEDPIMTTKID